VPVDVILVLGLSTGIIAWAFSRGSKPEKLGAAIVALNMCIDLAVRLWVGRWDFSAFSGSRFSIDLLEFGLLLLLALTANRVWPIFSAAAQMVAVGGSLAVWGSDGGMEVAYWAVTQSPLFGQLAALALGTFFHSRRQAVVGPYRDWRTGGLFATLTKR
jgi:hypothetical protein